MTGLTWAVAESLDLGDSSCINVRNGIERGRYWRQLPEIGAAMALVEAMTKKAERARRSCMVMTLRIENVLWK